MPVQITKKICTLTGVANGVITYVTGFQYTVADSGDSEVVAFTESRDGMTIPRCRGCVCEVSREWVQFL